MRKQRKPIVNELYIAYIQLWFQSRGYWQYHLYSTLAGELLQSAALRAFHIHAPYENFAVDLYASRLQSFGRTSFFYIK